MPRDSRAASAGLCLNGLDSEGANERSSIEEKPAIRFVARTRTGGWGYQRELCKRHRARSARRRGLSSPVLAYEHARFAVSSARIASRHAGHHRVWVLRARNRCRFVRMTPGAAEQDDVLPRGQCQHDRKKGCSEHVAARRTLGQELRQHRPWATGRKTQRFFGGRKSGSGGTGKFRQAVRDFLEDGGFARRGYSSRRRTASIWSISRCWP